MLASSVRYRNAKSSRTASAEYKAGSLEGGLSAPLVVIGWENRKIRISANEILGANDFMMGTPCAWNRRVYKAHEDQGVFVT
jgi:hypothetical protein